MDDVVRRAISLAEQMTKSAGSVPWTTNKPWKQAWHLYSSGERQWHAVEADPHNQGQAAATIRRLALYGWNIDFMLPFADSRMRGAIRHLEAVISHERYERTATVVFLQECVESDLKLIASDPSVQQTFAITDRSTENWQSGHYGTTTLIDKRLAICDVFRVHYEQTRMQRDGLFADVSLVDSSGSGRCVRLCNTHLESLALEPPLRPPQMRLCAEYMRSSSADAAIIAGDFNAIQDFDKCLHTDNDLIDAFLECGESEEDSRSRTWGQQAATTQRNRFGTSRMDRIFFCGEAIKCTSFERVGEGVEVEDETERKELINLGFDHARHE